MDRSVKVPSLGRLLGGSWVVISRVISPLIGVIIVTLLITPLITTHEPPSTRGKGEGGLLRAARCSRHHRRGRSHLGILKDLRSQHTRLSLTRGGGWGGFRV